MGGVSGCADIGDVEGRSVASEVPAAAAARHRRSRSASDKKLEFVRDDVAKCVLKVPSQLTCSQDKKANATQQQDHRDSQDNHDCVMASHRVSLENEIEQLKMRLGQEKSVRIMLEQSLGRASSTLSPGHKHFNSKTRELISEIQLLEEEVASREQQVLALYRSIFDHCVSGPPSSQCSGTPSPHTRTGGKKHPHVISSSFCSSRKLSLQSFQVLSSIRDTGKKDAPLHHKTANQLNGNTNCLFRRNSPMKVNMTVSTSGKSNLSCISKNNSLHHSPNELSEELVRWMASIYHGACEEETGDHGKTKTPMISRSSTSTYLPRQGVEDNHDAFTRTMVEVSCISMNKNPFSTTTIALRNYRSLIEELERVDVNKLESKAKLAFWVNVHNSLVMHAYLTYGIPYNSFGRMSLYRKVKVNIRNEGSEAAYNIGGHVICASTIAEFILCCHIPRANREFCEKIPHNCKIATSIDYKAIIDIKWLESILWTTMRKRSGEEKHFFSSGFNLLVGRPLVNFALCTGASSDPPLRVYTAKHVEEELEMAKKDFLRANVIVKKSKKVFLPKVIDRYAKDASINSDDLLTWVSNNVDAKLQESIQRCIISNPKKKAWQIMEWLPYSTRFRYVFDKSLTGTPLQ